MTEGPATIRPIVGGDQEYQELLARQEAQAAQDDIDFEGYFYQDLPELASLAKPGPQNGE